MKRELNFRRGKGLRRERSKSLGPQGVVAVMRFAGMTDEEIALKLKEVQIEAARKLWSQLASEEGRGDE